MLLQGERVFARDENGIAAVELALVLPVLLTLLVGIVDFGSLYLLRNNMVTVARESARALAVKSVSATEAQLMAENSFVGWKNATFTVVAEEPVAPNTDVNVTITVPMADVAPIGLVFGLTGFTGNLQAHVAMRQEG